MKDELTQIAEKCGFKTEKRTNRNPFSINPTSSYTIKTTPGTIMKPKEDLYFEISSRSLPSRKGSIGKLVALESVSTWTWIYHLYFEENKRTLKFDYYNCQYLKDYKGPTKYFFYKKEKKKIPERKNSFGQTLSEGNLVVGVGGTGKDALIVLGYVTRWTKYNVFVKPYGPFGKITNEKKGDIQLKNYMQTIVLPSDKDWQDILEKELFVTMLTSNY